MQKKTIRDYLFNKLFFPKVIRINRPGIIYNYVNTRFGGLGAKKRTIYHFEDIVVNLQLETIKELGEEKTQELFYKIGKDVATSYMLLSKTKKTASLFLPSIINYIFKTMVVGGFSVAEDIKYNHKKKSLILKGSNNMVCRKSRISSTTSGLVSGFISFLVGENIEAKAKCQKCPESCFIVANKDIKENYLVNLKELRPIKNYETLNFPTNIKYASKLYSFSELIKFKKIHINSSGKMCFLNKMIIPTIAECLGLTANHFIKINKKSILEKGLIDGAQNLAKYILQDKKTISEKIDAIKIMLGAFGWGIPNYKKEGRNIIFDFVYPPITQYSFLYQALVINGYLNYIFNKKFKIKEIKLIRNSIIRIKYIYL